MAVVARAPFQVVTAIGKTALNIQLNDQAAHYRPIFFAQSEGIQASGETQKNIHYTVILEYRGA